MKKANPYDPIYVMKRDNCSIDEAMMYIQKLKEKNAWNKGKKIKKANPYDPIYVMKRDNCSIDVAQETISNFKKNKATTLSNFIKKYGKDDGTLRYNDWRDKSLAKGWDERNKNGKSQSPRCKEYYIRHGASMADAILKALDYQHNNSPLHIQYYIKRGKTLDYAKKKIRLIHDKKLGIDSYKRHLKTTTTLSDLEIDSKVKIARGHNSRDNLGDVEFEKRQTKLRKTCERKGLWIPLNDLSDFKIYKRTVWKHTNMNDLSTMNYYDKRGLAGIEGAYHLDHKFSISRGYIEGIAPELIGCLQNLEFIAWEENISKQGNCSVLLEELYEN
jgi:hypothetical protein